MRRRRSVPSALAARLRSARKQRRSTARPLDIRAVSRAPSAERVVVHGDVHAVRAERDGDRATYAATRAGDERDATVELHGVPSWRMEATSPRLERRCHATPRAVRRAPRCVLLLEPRERHAHRAERARTIRSAMPIGAAARDEPKTRPGRDARRSSLLCPGCRTSTPSSPCATKLHELAACRTARVREHREPPPVMDRARSPHQSAVDPWPRTQVGLHRGIGRTRRASPVPIRLREHARHVRPADCGTSGDCASTSSNVTGTPSAFSFATMLLRASDGCRAISAARARARASLEVQAEHMRLPVALDGAQLDARHDAHAERRAGGVRLGDTVHACRDR